MNTGWTFSDWLQYAFSFALVIGLLLAVLWGLRKMQSGASFLRKNSQRLQTIESLSVGPRQKILLIQVDGQDVLVGVTAHQMTALSPWPVQAPAAAAAAAAAAATKPSPAPVEPKETQTS
jgi:flagellar protein FliO/FliZ